MSTVLGFAGYSGSGKTTLIVQLLPELVRCGLDVAVMKHTHHQQITLKAGSDSERYQETGARQVMLVNDHQRWLNGRSLSLSGSEDIFIHLNLLSPCDLVLVEGYKHACISKIEVINSALKAPYLFLTDKQVIAIVSDVTFSGVDLPSYQRNDIEGLLAFILDYIHYDSTSHANR